MKTPKNNILPDGFYSIDGDTVRLNQGPYRGVSFSIGKIKIRTDYLTDEPQMLYDYIIHTFAGFDPQLLNTDPKFSRIVAAVILDESLDQCEIERN